ncbi:rhodanese-like domain-containing protein [Idiomarina abyssalis]|uniref:Rhodanese-like domain-containing protein n=1 Tax=Idiomarina abyssalis TaxID=86102 RepID=A0A8I1GB41_9GAMM|nr:rhodanese-like domain-containing protein [Idiomarina abyssalis]MBJ7266973.1 rhodanese-like domain-containing protein [Idiomarina abyssalis]MBJ7272613.1 rhodanese-like domain-containing protein [Idiomarina abyssalis]MBJ7316469.1 rhodanese-like domain-containing protein [Idiomarina abyssalis]
MQELFEFVSRNPMMSGVWVVLLIALIVTTIRSAMSPMKSLQPQEATVWVNRGDGVFVDIRNKDEFKKGHIHGSVSLPAEKIKQKELSTIEKFKEAPIVIVCATGMTAKSAASQLIAEGFNQVAVLQGGINTWRSAKLPVSQKK